MFSFINNPLILQYTIIMNMVYAYDHGDEHIGCAYHFFLFLLITDIISQILHQ